MDGNIDKVREALDYARRFSDNIGVEYRCNAALAALSAHDEAIRRECAYKAKQAVLSAPHDNPTRAYAAALAEEAILSAEPAQDGAEEPWHTEPPSKDGLYLAEVDVKFSSPSPWYETAFFRKRDGWSLPEPSKGLDVVAWMEILRRADLVRRTEEAEE